MKKSVRVRFAPSPTGLLHIGGVRTALFNYLFARRNEGQFILRLEDTDRERFEEKSVEQIEKSLQWLGLVPAEGYWLGEHIGKVGPYVQSQRLPHYKEYALKLIDQGLAYYSNATSKEIDKWRDQAARDKRPFVYKKYLEKGLPELKNRPIRFDTAAFKAKFRTDDISWSDEIRGEFNAAIGLVDDFVILKSDDYPTYNFANVVDDHLMKITHVIRGDEFIASTAKHIMLYLGFNWQRPKFIHLPTILGPGGKKKLSKRDGDADVTEYQKQGYLPQALVNFLALLGWNDGTEQEIFTIKELIDKFDISRVQKSPAVFDIERLKWMNGEYIRSLSVEEFTKRCLDFIPRAWQKDQNYLQSVLKLEQERIKYLAEVKSAINFFFVEPKTEKSILLAKTKPIEAKDLLESVLVTLNKTQYMHGAIEKSLRKLCDKLQCPPGKLFYLIRVAITGRTAAPGLFDTIVALGKDRVEGRLKKAIGIL